MFVGGYIYSGLKNEYRKVSNKQLVSKYTSHPAPEPGPSYKEDETDGKGESHDVNTLSIVLADERQSGGEGYPMYPKQEEVTHTHPGNAQYHRVPQTSNDSMRAREDSAYADLTREVEEFQCLECAQQDDANVRPRELSLIPTS